MIRKVIVSLMSYASLVSCGPIVREVRHPGGYPGYLLDNRMFDASRSKKLQLLRASIILSMAARMGTATIRDGKDAAAFSDYLAAAADEINYAAGNLYAVEGIPACSIEDDQAAARKCAGYYAIFESDMPMMEARITRLMLAALPEDRARAFLQDLSKGNVMSAAWSALRVLYETTGGLHRATGVYRSGLELVAANMDCPGDAKYDQSTGTVWNAAECLGLTHDQLFENPHEVKGDDLPHNINRDTFEAVMLIARTSCARLQITTDGATSESIDEQIIRRNNQCNRVQFNPKARPTLITAKSSTIEGPDIPPAHQR